MGFVWSVPVSSKENDMERRNGGAKRIIGGGGPKLFLGRGFGGSLQSLDSLQSLESLEMDIFEKTPFPKDPFLRTRVEGLRARGTHSLRKFPGALVWRVAVL